MRQHVQIPLAQTDLHILQSRPLVGQRTDAFREQSKIRNVDRKLTARGREFLGAYRQWVDLLERYETGLVAPS